MSFYTKYQELGLGDSELISWLEFNGNLNDSGPNGNHWTVDSLGSLLATSGRADFTTQTIEYSGGDVSNFTAFFDVEKLSATEQQCILSSAFDGGQFGLFWAPGGSFFISTKDEANQITSTVFFKKIEPSKRCILCLSKFGNAFFLYFYEPFSDTLESDQITIPYGLFYQGTGFNINFDSFGFGEDGNFTLHEFAVIQEGIPGFCILALCREIYQSGDQLNTFGFFWLSAKEKVSESVVDNPVGLIHREKANIILPYSIAPEGFSTLGRETGAYTRVYADGLPVTFVDHGGYITFAGMNPGQTVLADFFDGTEGLGSTLTFNGLIEFIGGKGAATVSDFVSGTRFIEGVGYRFISNINMSAGLDFVIPSTEGIVEI